MSNNVFEVADKSGRKIRLTKTQWAHMIKNHGEIVNYLEEIKETLVHPLKIIIQQSGELRRYYSYQKNRKHPEKYLRVLVKYLNGDGFVITSHFVRNLN